MPTGTRSIARIDRASTRSITPTPPRVRITDTFVSRRSKRAKRCDQCRTVMRDGRVPVLRQIQRGGHPARGAS